MRMAAAIARVPLRQRDQDGEPGSVAGWQGYATGKRGDWRQGESASSAPPFSLAGRYAQPQVGTVPTSTSIVWPHV
jgi:hypothetical protein